MIANLSHNLTAMTRVGLGACPYLLKVTQSGVVALVHPEMLKMQNGSQSPPLKKGDLGGFRGIYKGLPNPPQPPFSKGGSFNEFPDEN